MDHICKCDLQMQIQCGVNFSVPAGSKRSLIAIQLVAYPTNAPATGSVHGLGATACIHNARELNCTM